MVRSQSSLYVHTMDASVLPDLPEGREAPGRPPATTKAMCFGPSARTTLFVISSCGSLLGSRLGSISAPRLPAEESRLKYCEVYYERTNTSITAQLKPGSAIRISKARSLSSYARFPPRGSFFHGATMALFAEHQRPALSELCVRFLTHDVASVPGTVLENLFGRVGARHRPPGGAPSVPSSCPPLRRRSVQPPLFPAPPCEVCRLCNLFFKN